MPRVENLNIVTTYGETGYIINDLGQNKSPRFELYHIPIKKSIKKSNNPLDFDEYMVKIWQKEGKCTNVQQDTTEQKSQT